jgi:hypothetical protein
MLSRIALVLAIASAWSCAHAADQGEMFDIFLPIIRPLWCDGCAGAMAEPSVALDGGGRFSRTSAHAGARVQPYRSDHDELTLGANAAETRIGGGAALPEAGPLPERLYRIDGSLAWRHLDDDRRVYGLSATVGSASDRPFASADVLSVSATAFTRLPAGGDDAWLLFLNYANNRAVLNNVPLPGVGYLLVRDRVLTAMIGLPFAFVSWHPRPWFDADLGVSGLGSAHAGVAARPLPDGAPWLRLHAAYDWHTDTFKRADRQDLRDQLMFREMTLTAGLACEPGKWFKADFSGGYAFQREMFEDHSTTGHHSDLLDIPPGAVFAVEFSSRF